MRVRLILISFTLAAILVQRCTIPCDHNEDAMVLKQLELSAITAEFRMDTGSISKIMHEHFVAIYPHKIQNKHQELRGIYDGIVERKKRGESVDSVYLDDFRAQFHNNGQTAIVTFYTVTKGTNKGDSFENRRWRWYDVWIKERGEWKLVAIQGTPL